MAMQHAGMSHDSMRATCTTLLGPPCVNVARSCDPLATLPASKECASANGCRKGPWSLDHGAQSMPSGYGAPHVPGAAAHVLNFLPRGDSCCVSCSAPRLAVPARGAHAASGASSEHVLSRPHA
jgi:hypothetical protein